MRSSPFTWQGVRTGDRTWSSRFVHVDAGTANACMSIQNLFRYRLPVMLFAGRAPFMMHGELLGSRDTYVHFVQDPFDIASIVRPYVK
jgi:acetolactate synthase-1/2/3 large subunit